MKLEDYLFDEFRDYCLKYNLSAKSDITAIKMSTKEFYDLKNECSSGLINMIGHPNSFYLTPTTEITEITAFLNTYIITVEVHHSASPSPYTATFSGNFDKHNFAVQAHAAAHAISGLPITRTSGASLTAYKPTGGISLIAKDLLSLVPDDDGYTLNLSAKKVCKLKEGRCSVCDDKVEDKVFSTFSYKYCSTCKEEVV